MELQFDKQPISCLNQVKWEQKNQELTQEIRLTEDLPDVGSVLGAWGQTIVRGKQWRKGNMEVTGGVMVFVLYAPEDGSAPRGVQTWLPFTANWELPETKHDGTICACCQLTGVDARSASARKLIVRAGLGILGEALVPEERELTTLGEIPEDVQVLRRKYPVRLPTEAGEKAFTLEDTMNPPTAGGGISRILRYGLVPEILDEKVMEDKVVFRGIAQIHVLYMGTDDCLYPWDFEVPFSQYTQLDQEHALEAQARIVPAITSLELEPEEDGQVQLKAGLACQYVIFDSRLLEVAEDGYSNTRKVSPCREPLELPVLLDWDTQPVAVEESLTAQGTRMADGEVYWEQPQILCQEQEVSVCLRGTVQMLYYDLEGNLQWGSQSWEWCRKLEAHPNAQLQAQVLPVGKVSGSISGAGGTLRGELSLTTTTRNSRGMSQVTGLELGDPVRPDPNRPSLIVRKPGEADLWALAKSCGSTMDAISQANGLEGEPDPDALLLIPVM